MAPICASVIPRRPECAPRSSRIRFKSKPRRTLESACRHSRWRSLSGGPEDSRSSPNKIRPGAQALSEGGNAHPCHQPHSRAATTPWLASKRARKQTKRGERLPPKPGSPRVKLSRSSRWNSLAVSSLSWSQSRASYLFADSTTSCK